MKTQMITGIAFAAGLLGAALIAGCGGNGNGNGLFGGSGGGSTPHTFVQIDRLARPAVNEVFATVANNRHQTNDQDNPTDDSGQLANDIQSFMTGTAGRSQATTNFVKTVLVPDVMKADLMQNTTTAAYLGVETGGATGSLFGGRALTDDVVDRSLGVIFGPTASAFGVADDHKEIATLTTDNVGPGAKHFTAAFPYLGAPQ